MIMHPDQELKSYLAQGGKALGCWLFTTDPVNAEIIGRSGFDCVMIDQEHGPGTPASAVSQLQALAAAGARNCLLRVADNDPIRIKRALDVGATSIMVPMVENAEQARRAVAACRFPPKGIRGCATPVVRASGYGLAEADYLKTFEDRIMVICQIENRAGLDQIEAIAAVDGVDMLFVGPMDLAAELGFMNSRDDPRLTEILTDAEARIQQSGVAMGTVPYLGWDAPALFDRGYALVLGASDITLLRDAAGAQVAAHRRRYQSG